MKLVVLLGKESKTFLERAIEGDVLLLKVMKRSNVSLEEFAKEAERLNEVLEKAREICERKGASFKVEDGWGDPVHLILKTAARYNVDEVWVASRELGEELKRKGGFRVFCF